MKRTTLTIVLTLLCFIFTMQGQNPITISGRIKTPDQKPLAGATVKIEGSNVSTTTDKDGVFKLISNTTSGYISLSYTGYKKETRHFSSGGHLIFEIILSEDQSVLEEVEINAGYYTVKDKERTGSISRVNAETIGKQPISNPLLALQGTATGIQVQQVSGNPGSNVNVIIRGRNSIAGGSNPFYVIDGVPFNSQSLSSSLSSNSFFGSQGSSPLNILNPNDIESIEILKDADATAIYGSRGANGVVLITTKKNCSGGTLINANVQSGLSQVASKLQMMNTAQYLEMRGEGFKNDGATPTPTDYDSNGAWDKNGYTNWQEELIGGTAHFSNAQLSLSGGNTNTQVSLSGNYQSQSNVYQKDYQYRKYSGSFSGTHSAMNEKLKANFSLIYGADDNNQLYADLTARAISLSPNAPVLYSPDGKLNWENSSWVNPLREQETRFLARNNTLVGNFTLSYQIFDALRFKANIGYNDNRLTDRSLTPSTFYDPAQKITPANALGDFNESKVNSWVAEPQLDYTATIWKGKLSVLTGLTFQAQKKEQLVIRATGFVSDALIGNIRAASSVTIRDYQDIGYNYQAIYGRINYNVSDRYLINLTGRRDGSSRFGPGKQFANFGALGLAWIVSEEKAVKNHLTFLSFGKLRSSYGITGNDQIGDYEFLDTYNSTGAYNGLSGLVPARLYNPDLAWEVNKKFELGLDLGFLHDRISLSLDYYQNRSSNQLIIYALAATTGFTGIRSNFGATVQNSGIEIDLSANILKRHAFHWSGQFNLTIPQNKLVRFPSLASSSYSSQYLIGHSLDLQKLYQYKGVNQQTGLYEMEDLNGDGKITAAEDKQVLVDRSQHFYGGIRNTFSFKNFELGCLFQFVSQTKGNYYSYALQAPGRVNNQSPEVLKGRWQNPGDLASVQKFSSGSNPLARTAYSLYTESDAVVNRSYFARLKNVDLSYTAKAFKDILARVFIQGQNLFMISNYFGLDPELTSNVLPPLKTLTLGLQLTL